MKAAQRSGQMLLAIALIMAFSVESYAQRGRGGGRGGRGGSMLRMMLPVEQTLGYLAFDDKIDLKDDQLLNIRTGLRTIHVKRTALAEEMRDGGDREALMEKFRGLREEMLASVKSALNESQNELLDKYLKRIQEARQRRGGGGGGGRGPRGGGTE